MSEKLDNIINELKAVGMITLYGNRIMGYKSGAGEIQPWNIKDSSNEGSLIIYNDCAEIEFDSYEIEQNRGMTCKKGDAVVLSFKFPSQKRIIENHNTFYVEEFCSQMEQALSENVESKGDWYSKFGEKAKTFIEGSKRNLSHIKQSSTKEEVQKACVDAANYIMMCYYLFNEKEQNT